MSKADKASWTKDDVRHFLKAYGLQMRDFDIDVLAGGEDNLNLLVQGGGKQLVLRRYDVTEVAEVQFELDLIHYLSEQGFPTAPLLTREDGSLSAQFMERPAALFGFVAGTHPQVEDVEIGRQVAATLADLHSLTRDLVLPYERSRTDLQRLEQLCSFVDVRRQELDDPELPEFVAQIESYRADFAERITPYGAALPVGIVHHDVHAGNVLVDDRDKLVALLDFDEAHPNYLVTDLASLVDAWARGEDGSGIDSARAADLLAAYDQQRSLLAGEWELLPDFIALFYLAGAAEYVLGRWRYDTTSHAVADSGSYAAFRNLVAGTEWRKQLRSRLQGNAD